MKYFAYAYIRGAAMSVVTLVAYGLVWQAHGAVYSTLRGLHGSADRLALNHNVSAHYNSTGPLLANAGYQHSVEPGSLRFSKFVENFDLSEKMGSRHFNGRHPSPIISRFQRSFDAMFKMHCVPKHGVVNSVVHAGNSVVQEVGDFVHHHIPIRITSANPSASQSDCTASIQNPTNLDVVIPLLDPQDMAINRLFRSHQKHGLIFFHLRNHH